MFNQEPGQHRDCAHPYEPICKGRCFKSVCASFADHLLFPLLPCLFSVTVAAVNADNSVQMPRVLLHNA